MEEKFKPPKPKDEKQKFIAHQQEYFDTIDSFQLDTSSSRKRRKVDSNSRKSKTPTKSENSAWENEKQKLMREKEEISKQKEDMARQLEELKKMLENRDTPKKKSDEIESSVNIWIF